FEAVGFGYAGAAFGQGGIDLVVSERSGVLTALQERLDRLVGLPVHPNPSQGQPPAVRGDRAGRIVFSRCRTRVFQAERRARLRRLRLAANLGLFPCLQSPQQIGRFLRVEAVAL